MGIHVKGITLQNYFKIYTGLGLEIGAFIPLVVWGRN